jgi:hypothetical protein
MNRDDYQRYLDSFNGKDYDQVLSFWAPDFKVWVQGELLFDSPESLRRTYGFLHAHVKEEIFVKHFLSNADVVFMEAVVRITALKTVTAEALVANDIRGIMPIEAGTAVDIPQFVHYHLENGKFKTGICLVSGPPVPAGL